MSVWVHMETQDFTKFEGLMFKILFTYFILLVYEIFRGC